MRGLGAVSWVVVLRCTYSWGVAWSLLQQHCQCVGVYIQLAAWLPVCVLGCTYTAWMSFRAIESPGTADDKLWLTYWVVYGAFSIVEYFVDFILFWVPFYYLLKFSFLLYLGLPGLKVPPTTRSQSIHLVTIMQLSYIIYI